MAQRKNVPAKPMPRPKAMGTAKAKPKSASGIAAIAKRFGITAREARDIATAVSTAVKTSSKPGAGKFYAVQNLKDQIKEVGTAATTGKKGTRSGVTQSTKESGNAYIDAKMAKYLKDIKK
jgi:hypothetical protein